ncbi:MAG: hypothetical protein R2830_00805 [Saprospiraceae bacterium]
MKSIWFFYIGAGIDLIALAAALLMMLSDLLKGTSGTNNPTMFTVFLLGAALVGGAFPAGTSPVGPLLTFPSKNSVARHKLCLLTGFGGGLQAAVSRLWHDTIHTGNDVR